MIPVWIMRQALTSSKYGIVPNQRFVDIFSRNSRTGKKGFGEVEMVADTFRCQLGEPHFHELVKRQNLGDGWSAFSREFKRYKL
jgi:hypothetical protein